MNSRLNQTDPNNQSLNHIAMESRAANNAGGIPQSYRKLVEDQWHRERLFLEGLASSTQQKQEVTTTSGYFSVESMLVLVGLAVSLLILPLMLPTLPPPPLLLLVVPIGIFGLLMAIAFMPSNVRNLTYAYNIKERPSMAFP